MEHMKTGLSDIQIHLPSAKIDLNTLIDERVKDDPRLERHLQRACRVTGQRAIRFPSVWEDTNTLAASSALKIFEENPALDVSKLRYLTAGTESGVDHSKPVASFVEGMLQEAGVNIPESISTFEVQHACAAGTLSLLSVSALLSAAGQADESGLVVCSDVARYESHSTAEVTQGAGSVSLLVENEAQLMELDLRTQGYSSKDVDDFFRPLGSKVAVVKGTYSMRCYKESLESAFMDHCRRRGELPEEVLAGTDLFVLHTPFRNLPETSMFSLLENHMGLDESQAKGFLEDRGFYDGIDPIGDIGNLYTGAVYVNLAFALRSLHERYGDQIVGKNVLLASYGSGNTMIVIRGTVAEGAAAVIGRWDLASHLENSRDATFDEYEHWVAGPYEPTGLNLDPNRDESIKPYFALESVREDGYREYAVRKRINTEQKSKTPIHLFRSA
jgi:hydroxymethylglutaryl-CoA synthase